MAYLMKTRKQLIQYIHIGKSKLCMDDDTYRAMLSNVVGVTSAKDATWTQLESVLEHMKGLGFRPTRQYSPKSKSARSSTTDALRALWIHMYKDGLIADGSESALRHWVVRMQRIDSPQWLTDMHAGRALESLKQWHKRLMIEKLERSDLTSLSYNDVLEVYEQAQKRGDVCRK